MESSGLNPMFQDVEFTELVISDVGSTKVSSPASVKDGKAMAVHQSSIQESSPTSTSVVSHADNPEHSNTNSIEQVTATDSDPTVLENCRKTENGNDGKPLVIKISTRGNLQNSSTIIAPAENGADNLTQDSLYSKAQCKEPETAVLISNSSPADSDETDIMVSSQSKTVTSLQMHLETNLVDNKGTNINDCHVAGPVKTNDKCSSACDAALVVVDDEGDAEVTVLDGDSSQKQNYRQQQLVYDSNDEVISSDSEADSSTSEDESDSSSVESTSSSSEEEDEEKEKNEEKGSCKTNDELVPTKETSQKTKKKNTPKGPKRGQELTLEDLPKIEDLQISVPEEEAESIGVVTSIVDHLVVVQSHPNLRAIDLGSILFLKQGSEALGEIHDVMGCVARPYYVVRFNSRLHITERGIAVGQEVFSAPRTNHCTFVDVEALTSKPGSDASWEHDMEPPPSLLEYSDDEEEQRIRRAKKNRNRNEESFVIRPEQQQKRLRNENYFTRSNGASNGPPPVRFTGQRGRGGGQAHHTAFSARNHLSNGGFRCSNSNQTANSHQSFSNPSFGSHYCPQPVREGQYGPAFLRAPPPSATLPSFATPPPFARLPFSAPPPFAAPPSTPPPRSLWPPPPPPSPSPMFTAPPPSLNFTTASQSGLPWAASSSSQYNTSVPPPPHRQPGPPGESEFPAAFSMATPPPSSQYFDSHQRFGQPPPPPPPVVQGTPGGPAWDGGSGHNVAHSAPRQPPPVVGCVSSASQFSNPWAVPPPPAQNSCTISSSVSNQFVPQFPSIPFSATNPSQPPPRPQ